MAPDREPGGDYVNDARNNKYTAEEAYLYHGKAHVLKGESARLLFPVRRCRFARGNFIWTNLHRTNAAPDLPRRFELAAGAFSIYETFLPSSLVLLSLRLYPARRPLSLNRLPSHPLAAISRSLRNRTVSSLQTTSARKINSINDVFFFFLFLFLFFFSFAFEDL